MKGIFQKKIILKISAFIILSLCIVLLKSFVFNNDIKTLPNFKIKTINGDTLSYESFREKVVVINIWATWCAPCVEEITILNRVCDKYKEDKNVLFVAMTDENTETVKKFLSNHDFRYTQVADASILIKKLQKGLFSVRPINIIINRNGEIAARKVGTGEIEDFLISNIENNK